MGIDFDHYTLDLERRLMLCDGAPIRVSPKAFDLLSILVEAAPRALAKSELHDRIWPSTYVTESNLAGLVKELRALLNDDARDSRFIRTVHGYGYAFCGEVRGGREPRAAAAWLTVDGDDFPLFDGENIVGRHRSADVRIDHPTVSRRHAILSIEGGRTTIVDLDSKNGTTVARRALRGKVALEPGSEIAFGVVQARFLTESPAASTVTVNRKK